MKKRILFVDHDPGISGSTVSLGYIVSKFLSENYEVFIITPKKGNTARYFSNLGAFPIIFSSRYMNDFTLDLHFTADSSFSRRTIITLLKNAGKFFNGLIYTIKKIKEIRPDLVYINEYVVIQSSIASHILKIPVALHIRSLFLNGFLGIRRYLLSKAIVKFNNLIFAISFKEKQQLNLKKNKENIVKVIGEFLDKMNFQTFENIAFLKSKFGIPCDKNVVTLLGGISFIKGTLDFIKAAIEVLKINPDTIFVIAGKAFKESEENKKYFDQCKQFGDLIDVRDSILYYEHIENPVEIIACSDIIVSLNRKTHFSRPIIEAWAQKKPVISYATDHAKNLIDDNINGLLIDIGDIRGLSKAISQILSNPQVAQNFGLSGYNKAQKEFDSEKNLQVIYDYCRLLHK